MKKTRLFVTYLKNNNDTGEVYAGHASGKVDAKLGLQQAIRRVLRKRESSHHKNQDGFGSATVDKACQNKDAILGREQMLIDHFRKKGNSGNDRNAISPRRKKKMARCLKAAAKLFGTVCLAAIIVSLLN